jgi:hypothetical protein
LIYSRFAEVKKQHHALLSLGHAWDSIAFSAALSLRTLTLNIRDKYSGIYNFLDFFFFFFFLQTISSYFPCSRYWVSWARLSHEFVRLLIFQKILPCNGFIDTQILCYNSKNKFWSFHTKFLTSFTLLSNCEFYPTFTLTENNVTIPSFAKPLHNLKLVL